MGAAHYAAVRKTMIDTARLAGAGPFQTILKKSPSDRNSDAHPAAMRLTPQG
jgi:hypothetical protein